MSYLYWCGRVKANIWPHTHWELKTGFLRNKFTTAFMFVTMLWSGSVREETNKCIKTGQRRGWVWRKEGAPLNGWNGPHFMLCQKTFQLCSYQNYNYGNCIMVNVARLRKSSGSQMNFFLTLIYINLMVCSPYYLFVIVRFYLRLFGA